MAKGSGGTRLLGETIRDTSDSYNKFLSERDAKDTEGGGDWIFFNFDSGGYVITEKGHNLNEDELEFAKVLARNGYGVTLTNEKEDGISFRLSSKGDPTHPDGKAGSYDVYYEQSTPTTEKSGKNGYRQALIHANSKGVPVAAVYDKYNKLHREDIDRGINAYEELRAKDPKKYLKVKGVLVVNSKGELYSHWK